MIEDNGSASSEGGSDSDSEMGGRRRRANFSTGRRDRRGQVAGLTSVSGLLDCVAYYLANIKDFRACLLQLVPLCNLLMASCGMLEQDGVHFDMRDKMESFCGRAQGRRGRRWTARRSASTSGRRLARSRATPTPAGWALHHGNRSGFGCDGGLYTGRITLQMTFFITAGTPTSPQITQSIVLKLNTRHIVKL